MNRSLSANEPSEDHPGAANFNFVQLSRSYLREMRGLARKSPVAHEILYYLVEHMGRTTNAVVCSRNLLVEVTGCSIATVGRAIRVLKDDNWIDTVKIGNASAYCVNERAFWQAGRNQRQYAVFSATVIASSSEQDSDFKEKAKQKLTYIPVIEEDARLMVNPAEQLPPPDQHDLDLS
uniref:Plasmid replication protein RepL domain-containing protein n=1 Tax=uncultured prokaryote TaxID=198431 RepID=A0A0H5Q8G1_9ZZZZ|nr:hypothetical protein [uncultured prokaryote]